MSGPHGNVSERKPKTIPARPRGAGGAGGMEITKEQEKALGLAINHIERQYGKGSIMRLGTDRRIQ